jgi:hypothetical protein
MSRDFFVKVDSNRMDRDGQDKEKNLINGSEVHLINEQMKE